VVVEDPDAHLKEFRESLERIKVKQDRLRRQ